MKRLAFAAVVAAVFATTWPMAASAADEAPFVVKLRLNEIEVRADGLSTRTMHIELQARNDAAANQLAQQAIPFSEALSDLEIIEAYTLKPNGEKISVNPSAIYTQQPQGASSVPQFDDTRQKVIVFPNVAGGDTIVYSVKYIAKKQLFPGHFFFTDIFPTQVAFNEVVDTIVVPKSFPLNIETHDVEFDRQEKGDKITYRWHYAAPVPVQDDDVPQVSALQRMPRLIASSMKNYEELGRAYSALAMPKASITPKIQALADQLTAGIGDRRQQAQKIYEWVSKNIRYVAVELGTSAIVPHEADSVLGLAYGDCKDHSVLFSALLKAKDIDSEIVLIEYGNDYSLTEIPSLLQFNHVIVWLPEFDMYADTTAGVAPFGTLPFAEYGKPVVHVSANGASVRKTGLLPPGSAALSLKVTAHLQNDGKISGDTEVTASGPFSLFLRGTATAIQQVGPARFASTQLERQGSIGTGSFEVTSPTELAPDYKLTGSFSLAGKNEFVTGTRFPPIRGVWVTGAAGDFLMGPLPNEKLKDTEPTACFSGRQEEWLSLDPPPGKHFNAPPADFHIQTANLEFTAHWTLMGDTIVLKRDFVSNIDQALCSGGMRAETSKALARIRDHYDRSLISLRVGPQVRSGEDLDAGVAAMRRGEIDEAIRLYTKGLGESDLSPALKPALTFDRGIAYLRQRNYDKAISDFSETLKSKPDDVQSLLNRGIAYRDNNDLNRAIRDYDQAIKLEPSNVFALNLRGITYRRKRDLDHAFQDFDRATKLDANFAPAYVNLGLTYGDKEQYEAAIHEFDQAIKLNSKDSLALNSRGIAYRHLHDLDRALADFGEVIKLEPMSAAGFNNRGLVYGDKSDYEHAISDFDAAIRINANYGLAFANRGNAKLKAGDKVGSDADLKRARELKVTPKRDNTPLFGLLDGLF